MQESIKKFYASLSDDTKEELRIYLERRFAARNASPKVGVVFDVLHNCILRCKGCGTNATFSRDMQRVSCAPTITQINKVFYKLKEYSYQTGKRIFVNIGGGEPFLRHDILDILQLAADYFGPENVGVDTNAALDNSEQLLTEAMQYVSYIGTSINGLRDYHNWWAGNDDIDAFTRTTTTVRKLCKNSMFSSKIEVTSVATTKNMAELPALMQFLADLGIKQYSVHRAIPVGRMALHQDLIPDASDYLHLLISLMHSATSTGLEFHIHHSIESIHAALLLGMDTYLYDHIGNPDALSSIGIDPECNVVFDPWCTTGCWKQLSSGNLLTHPGTLDEMLHTSDSVFQKTDAFTSSDMRCNGCPMKCSGGSRIVAATHELCGRSNNSISAQDIYTAMQAVDPACPLYRKD